MPFLYLFVGSFNKMPDITLSVPPSEAGPRSTVVSGQSLRPVTDTVPEGVSEDNAEIVSIDHELERLRELMKFLSCPGFTPDGSGLAYKKFSMMVSRS
jgi:hypothetical protein